MENESEKIRRYLLGALGDDEAARLESEYFGDEAKFSVFQAAENDLLDDYARGALGAADKKLFEEQYLAAPHHRERLEFSRTLAVHLADRPPPAVDKKPSFSTWFNFGRLGFALAGLLVLIVGGIFLLPKLFKPADEIARVTPTPAAPAPVSSPTAANVPEKTPSPVVNSPTPAVSPTPINSPTPTVKKPESSPSPTPVANRTAFLALAVGGLRSGGDLPKLALANGTKTATLALALPETTAREFAIVVQNGDGETVWQKKTAAAAGRKLTIRLPAAVLANDDYTIEVSIVKPDGTTEKLAGYGFRSIKK